MNFEERRKKTYEKMAEQSVLILFSGIPSHVSADEYAPFQASRNFFYLTGLRREQMILMMDNSGEEPETTLFIEKADPHAERWRGKKVTKEEAEKISGITKISFLEDFEDSVSRTLSRRDVETFYFDLYREQMSDMMDYNMLRAEEFHKKYPAVALKNLHPVLAALRMQKSPDEIAQIRQAIAVTDEGLKNVMRRLKPGSREYEAQADFEYTVKHSGADGTAFPTIAGSGVNGTMLHYETNRDICADGDLLLLDLGAKWQGYCADITRTYPVNGTFTDRQRQVYDIVLKANRTVAETAKPGMTLKELNEVCKKVLAEGCITLGLIKDEGELQKYYMHSVSHHLGIDVHDVSAASQPGLLPGAVITDEPGLYIDEWGIGIRIEDDLLITEEGCEVLSEAVIRDPDAIERFMAENTL